MPGGRRNPVDLALRELVAVYRAVGTDRPVSLDEAIHTAGNHTRRTFLGVAGLAAAGLAAGGCTTSHTAATLSVPRTTSAGGPRVVVVGAGLAGMTAAYRLRQAGVNVHVYEARDRVGGRCWSARGFAGGQVGEHGGEFIDTRHVHLRSLATELGLTLDDLWSVWEPGSTWLQYVDGEVVNGRQLLSVMQPAIRRLVSFAGGQGRGIAPGASRAMRRFDEATMADWYEQEVGSLDSPAYRLWASGQAGWWGLDPEGLGAGNLIDFYATEYSGDDERYTVSGGNDQVLSQIADELGADTVSLDSPLESVSLTSDGGYDLSFGGTSSTVSADRVVFTLPFTTFREVDLSRSGFSAARLAQIEQLGMGTNAKVLLQFDKSFPQESWSGGMQRADAPAFGTWESGGTDPGADDFGLLTVFSGGRVGTGYTAATAHDVASDQVVSDTLAAIDAVAPGTAASYNGKSWLDLWVQDPWSRGSYAAFLPTQFTTMFGVLGVAEGAAHFAGEHTSTFSQGYLNGGVESGSRAAAEVLDSLGLPLPVGLATTFREQARFEPVYPWASS